MATSPYIHIYRVIIIYVLSEYIQTLFNPYISTTHSLLHWSIVGRRAWSEGRETKGGRENSRQCRGTGYEPGECYVTHSRLRIRFLRIGIDWLGSAWLGLACFKSSWLTHMKVMRWRGRKCDSLISSVDWLIFVLCLIQIYKLFVYSFFPISFFLISDEIRSSYTATAYQQATATA